MAVSREEYLKRYLSSDHDSKDKKKRKTKTKPSNKPRMGIVDDDITVNMLLPSNLHNTLEEDVGDNEPTIADFIDERPEHIKRLEEYQDANRWKKMNLDYGVTRSRHDSDSDQSLPGRNKHDSDSNQSIPRRDRHDSDSDQSIPRRNRHDSDSDQSLPRRNRHDSDSDQSPVRKVRGRRKESNSDNSPPRRGSQRNRHDSDSDKSPIKLGHQMYDSDQSPPRKGRHASDCDQSPPRRHRHLEQSRSAKHKVPLCEKETVQRGKKSRFNSESPPRRKQPNPDNDSSPPRRTHDKGGNSKKATKTLGGAKAGLSSAREMREEANRLKRKENEIFKKVNVERLGKNAKTVFRNKEGKRRNMAEEGEKEAEEQRRKAVREQKYAEWGKGLKQREELDQRLTDNLHEASKPLARYRDDEDLDHILKSTEREGDPMAVFLKKKKKDNDPKYKEKPKYKGPAPPPNRYRIVPGYRWDGVDRSNGFETQLFTKQSNKRATDTMAYQWSVEDM